MKKTTLLILKKSSVNSNKQSSMNRNGVHPVTENEHELINVRKKSYTFKKKKQVISYNVK